MRKLLVIILSLIMVLASVSLCFADQVFYIDPSTGDIINTGDAAEAATTGIVKLTKKCNFDKTAKLYVFPTESISGASVRSTIYDGMITTDPVTITVDAGAMVEVYHNGEVLSSDQYENIYDLGAYVVRDLSSDRELFRFTIVNEVTGLISSYNVPDIFYISRVKFNDADMSQVGNSVNLSEDGIYEIHYSNDLANKSYILRLTIDHTPPQLLISGVNAKGIANSTVRFGEQEENSDLVIEKDGEILVRSNELKEAGDYIVTYSDEAGNEVIYTFTIHFFLDLGGWLYVALLLMIVGAAVFYYFFTKKKLRNC